MTPRVGRLLASHAFASVAMSVAWPLLLVMVWEQTGSATWLGTAAAARMAPYVACSWWVGRLADRHRRDHIVWATLWARLVLLGAAATALITAHVTAALVFSTLAVAVATPAYPALAAALPATAGVQARRATDLLVTIEVSSFVVGPAVGSLLLPVPALVAPVTVLAALAGLALFWGQRLPGPQRGETVVETTATGRWLVSCPPVCRAIAVMAALNAVMAGAGISLLPMADTSWARPWDPSTAYGVASAALGFGALGGPLLGRLGRESRSRVAAGLALAAGALGVVAMTPSVGWAILPLLVIGAAAVHSESAATSVIQERSPDHLRATMLGVADAAMVSSALLGALTAPLWVELLGGPAVLAVLAVSTLATLRLVPGSLPADRSVQEQAHRVAGRVEDDPQVRTRLVRG